MSACVVENKMTEMERQIAKTTHWETWPMTTRCARCGDEWSLHHGALCRDEEGFFTVTVPKKEETVEQFYQGDKVEWESYSSARRRFGIVTNRFPVTGNYRVTDFVTGDQLIVGASRLTRVHGHIHIDTPQRRQF